MPRAKHLQQWVAFIIICFLLASLSQPVRAQKPQTSAAAQEAIKYTGTGDLIWDYRDDFLGVDLKNVCPLKDVFTELELLPDGTFSLLMNEIQNFPEKAYSHGEMHCNYNQTGRVLFTGTYTRNPNQLHFLLFQLQLPVDSGDGSFDDTSASGTVTAPGSFNGNTLTIHLTFILNSAQAAITSETIYTTYGIRVEDSFGGDGWDKKSWSDHELVLLNDLLKNLPPGFLNKISLNRIVRNKVKYNPNGTPKPGVAGTYYPCDKAVDPDCSGSSSTIRVFDAGATDWLNNDPDASFKVVILHEITHAYQYNKDQNSVYKVVTDSPKVQDYMEATKPINFEGSSSLLNGWDWTVPPGKWVLWTPDSNSPPMEYGKTNPIEDMAVSVSYYVYAPSELKKASPERYNYIRDYIYGGVEYENGIPKQP